VEYNRHYMNTPNVGVLAFHGDVVEHIRATKQAAIHLKFNINVIPTRTKNDVKRLDALIMPGGESTTLHTLCQREDMFEDMKKIPCLFGTCAGAILLAKHVLHTSEGQETLRLMDITVDRNAYGAQTESFEKTVKTKLGAISAVFIRAPKIKQVGKGVVVLAKNGNDSIACEEATGKQFFMACTFHPELTTTVFHEYFLMHLVSSLNRRT